jgi:hypothetical protein
VPVRKKVFKHFYSLFLQKGFVKPVTTQEKWKVDLKQIIRHENWNLYYQIAMKNVLSAKLQTF